MTIEDFRELTRTGGAGSTVDTAFLFSCPACGACVAENYHTKNRDKHIAWHQKKQEAAPPTDPAIWPV